MLLDHLSGFRVGKWQRRNAERFTGLQGARVVDSIGDRNGPAEERILVVQVRDARNRLAFLDGMHLAEIGGLAVYLFGFPVGIDELGEAGGDAGSHGASVRQEEDKLLGGLGQD